MAAGHLCDFCEILACWRCGGVFCWNLLKLRITVQPVMQKARMVEPKTQCSFVDTMRAVWGSLSGGRGFNCLLDL